MTDAELDMLQDLAGKVSPEGWRVYRGKFGDYGYYAIESFDDAMFIQRAVKPLPSGGGYKAHLNWNFCL